jgi:hypothetical protein
MQDQEGYDYLDRSPIISDEMKLILGARQRVIIHGGNFGF